MSQRPLLHLKSANVRLLKDCIGLQIHDETTLRCRSFSFMTNLKARAPLIRYRKCFSPLVSWCISAIVVGIRRREEVDLPRMQTTLHVVAKAVVVLYGV